MKTREFKMQSAKCKVQNGGFFPILQSVICNLQSVIIAFLSFLSVASALPLYRDSLPNGLIVLTYEAPSLPIVDFGFTCRSGSAWDPDGKSGVASLTTQLLNRGTTTMSGDSIASIIEYLGADYNSGTQLDYCGVSLRVLSKDQGVGLDLLTAMVRSPAFDPKEIEQAKSLQAAGVRRGFDNPSYVVRTAFEQLLYAGHPYRNNPNGDTLTIPGLQRADVKAFYQTWFVPNNCFIIAVGDIKREEFVRQVKARFGDWQPGIVPQLHVPELKYPDKLKVKLITRPDMNQTYVEFGHPGISITDPDMLATRLGDYILGGSPLSSRLGIAVREKKGLAYDVRSFFDRNKYPGAFWGTVQTAHPREAIQLMLSQIRMMHDSGATRAELAKACNYYTGSFPLTYSSNQDKLYSVGTMELYRLGLDWLDKFPDRVRAITLDQVNAAMRQHLSPGNYYMVVMGNVTKDSLGLKDVEWIE
jgi:zinc protease